MLRNFVVITLMLFSFSSALAILQRANMSAEGFSDLSSALLSLLQIVFNIEPPSVEGVGSFGLAALMTFVCLANVGMLNILIAQLSSSLVGIYQNTRTFAMAHRAQVCVEMESLLHSKQRQVLFPPCPSLLARLNDCALLCLIHLEVEMKGYTICFTKCG